MFLSPIRRQRSPLTRMRIATCSADIGMELNHMVPAHERYQHLEGNSPAHIKASLVGSSQVVFVQSKKLVLGTWQGIFFCEFDGPRNRQIYVKVVKAEE